ncbi:LacI family DNA-binding transcriptional regulator [Ruania halotolerans]|uniref:LacI family DNA-binding transcriptional regulator n=1 Tax=Ruania halotolerans TaxID=2897773 RepID=UPI001E4B8D0B|nr:LacI family DNA-binding transcriptional regulator [Ruania halotolerans]UFU07008.1 LacI family transcriptional regulator [Ruania halotolerans]
MPTTNDAKPLTLADIAKLAGVSRSAASRALDRRSPVGGERADRVRAIAAAHGYVPNSRAANLRRQRTGLIGVVVPRLTDTVMAMLYEAIVDECTTRGCQATVVTTDDDPRAELERGRALLDQRVDGFIVTTARTDGADPFLLELRDRGIPYALALRTDGESPSALGDDELGGYLATGHLIEAGHERIAFVGGAPYASSSQGRHAGYLRAMTDAGLTVSPELVHETDFSMRAGVRTGNLLLALADPPTAVFTANDSLAVGLISAALRAGLRVPEDLSLVGYNDTPIAAHLATPLTSLAVPFHEIAADAVSLLLDGPDASSGPVLRRAPRLVPRGSVHLRGTEG